MVPMNALRELGILEDLPGGGVRLCATATDTPQGAK